MNDEAPVHEKRNPGDGDERKLTTGKSCHGMFHEMKKVTRHVMESSYKVRKRSERITISI